MGWINVSWKLLAAVAVMQFYQRCVVLSYARVLYQNKTTGFSQSQVMGVYSVFVGFVTQLCSPTNVCVWSVDMLCAYIKNFPSSPRSAQVFCLYCTLIWLFHRETYLLSSPDPMVSRYNSTNNVQTPTYYVDPRQVRKYPVVLLWNSLHKLWLVGTTVQIMPELHHIMDTRQVREYPESTISKVLTILKWRMIMTLNRKLLEKQKVYNRFGFHEVHVHIGHNFYNVNTTVSFGNRLTLSIFRF